MCMSISEEDRDMSITVKSVSVPTTTTGFFMYVLRSAPSICQCVLDGGHLVHVIPWPTAATYKQVCQAYVTYTVCISINDGNRDE